MQACRSCPSSMICFLLTRGPLSILGVEDPTVRIRLLRFLYVNLHSASSIGQDSSAIFGVGVLAPAQGRRFPGVVGCANEARERMQAAKHGDPWEIPPSLLDAFAKHVRQRDMSLEPPIHNLLDVIFPTPPVSAKMLGLSLLQTLYVSHLDMCTPVSILPSPLVLNITFTSR
jgi:hypothetical protein